MHQELAACLRDIMCRRRSLRAFSPDDIEQGVLNDVLEAARSAASAFNEQPWRFIIVGRGQAAERERLLACVEPHNRLWAEHAPVLLAAVAKLDLTRKGGMNRHAFHDVGQATAYLALQAAAHGLTLHQIGGFEHEAAATALGVPAGFEVVTILTLAYPGSPDALPPDLRQRELAPRVRRPVAEFSFTGQWGQPYPADAGEDVAG